MADVSKVNVNSTDYNIKDSNAMHKGVDYVTAGKKSGTTLGNDATAEGSNTTASGLNCHAEGSNTTASASNTHAEGNRTTASSSNAHAEGSQTTASAAQAHAEGLSTTASGDYSHSEGLSTTASGNASHAEGSLCEAAGSHAHAEGTWTKASSHDQHAEGKYNVEDTNGTYVHIIGGGTSDNARKNIFTVDWNGVARDGTENRLLPFKPVSEAEYAALSQAEKTNGTAYFRYEANGIMREIQDNGSATSLTSGALPTGQTITSYLNSNLVTGTITEVSGVNYQHKRITKHFRTVFLELKVTIAVTSTGWKTIGTIADSSMRPPKIFDINVPDNNSSTSPLTCQIRVHADGTIQMYSFKTSGGYSPIIAFTYLV